MYYKTKKNYEDKFIDIPKFPSMGIKFCVGDVVRSYRSTFDLDKPYKYNYIEGVVIDVLDHDYIKVKWSIDNFFGKIYKCALPDGSDIFQICINSPHLVRINKGQLAMAL